MITLALALSPAHACGGFFCNSLEPTEQTREVLVFGVDPEEDKTTMHVQVDYEGPANLFAWVVPVRGEPDLFLSSAHLFSQLQGATAPHYTLIEEDLGICVQPAPPSEAGADSDGVPDWMVEGAIDVLATERVGPYDTVTVSAQNANTLVNYLQSQQYAVPRDLADVIAPYLADGHNFVALRLAAGEDVGSLAPLGMRYDGTTPTIPLHLTQVAAIDDMPITTWVVGPGRAVPSNWLHVTLNDAAVDWFDEGSNRADLLARAADQAGGHAFATDHVASARDFDGLLDPGTPDLAGAVDATDFVQRLELPLSSAVVEVLQLAVPLAEGQDPGVAYANPTTAEFAPGFDAAAAAALVEERLLEPLRSAQEMFDGAETVTRLSSAISPAEMTIDPQFHFDTSLPQQVSRERVAVLENRCEGLVIGQAPRALRLPDGGVIDLPSADSLAAEGMTESDWLAQLEEPAAVRIEDFSPSEGGATVMFDGTVQVARQIEALNAEVQDVGRRGCDVAAGSGGFSASWFRRR